MGMGGAPVAAVGSGGGCAQTGVLLLIVGVVLIICVLGACGSCGGFASMGGTGTGTGTGTTTSGYRGGGIYFGGK